VSQSSPPRSGDPSGPLVAIERPIAFDPARAASVARFVFDARDGAGGGEVVVAIGEAARVEARGPGRWESVRRDAEQLLARVGGDAAGAVRMVGGAAFEADGEIAFSLPRWTLFGDGPRGRAVLVAPARDIDPMTVEEELAGIARAAASPESRPSGHVSAVSRDAGDALFEGRVRAALAAIAAGEAEKIVVGRRERLVLDAPADADAAWARLRAGEPGTIRLLVRGRAGTLMAATPERLLVRRGTEVVADALAGTVRRRAGDDEATRAALLGSEKDQREHAFVVRAIEAILSSMGGATRHDDAPTVRSLRALHHLVTEVHATFATPPHALLLAAALHPTPAVAGVPREAAMRFVAANEPDRGWFTGAAGWFDRAGEGVFAVVLRAALLHGLEVELFAGTGIVAGSEPAQELAETEAKLAAARSALGLGAVEG
jgi:menaquinone-specific isochorismate synthase